MRAVILAAGLGRRMRPLTDHMHKSLLPVGDSTILGRIVDGLCAIEVRDILVVTGYRAGEVREFLASRYPEMSFRFVHNERFSETNNIVSLAMAFDAVTFDEDVLLIESDLLFDPSVLQRLRHRRGNVALVDRYRPGMDGTVVSVDDGVVTGVFPPHLQRDDFVYADKWKTLNVYRFDKDFCRDVFAPLLSLYARRIDGNCYYELVLGMLVSSQRDRILAELVDGTRWAEVDDPNDLAAARFVFEPERRKELLDRSHGGYWNYDILDFTYLRNMHFPTDAMLASMRQALPALLRGYGSAQPLLDEKLANFLLCARERVLILNGASQAFPLLADLWSQRAALLPSPSFGEMARSFPTHRTYADAPGIDLDAVDLNGVELAVFVNPNNPTGTTLPSDRLHALAAGHPQIQFLVDESFMAFAGQPSLLEKLELEPLDNVLVLASLSKSLGVPGLRLGYLYSSNAALLARLRARVPIWNLNALAEFYLEIVLKFRDELARSLERSAADRAQLAAALLERPWARAVYPSGGNFLLVRLDAEDPARGATLAEALMQRHRIYIKDVSLRWPRPAPHIRLAVRLPDEHARLVAAIDEDWGRV